jgi:hypothetical protein
MEIVEPLVGCLGFPLGANRDGELVGDLPKGHLVRGGTGGLLPVGAELRPAEVGGAEAWQ